MCNVDSYDVTDGWNFTELIDNTKYKLSMSLENVVARPNNSQLVFHGIDSECCFEYGLGIPLALWIAVHPVLLCI